MAEKTQTQPQDSKKDPKGIVVKIKPTIDGLTSLVTKISLSLNIQKNNKKLLPNLSNRQLKLPKQKLLKRKLKRKNQILYLSTPRKNLEVSSLI